MINEKTQFFLQLSLITISIKEVLRKFVQKSIGSTKYVKVDSLQNTSSFSCDYEIKNIY